MIVQFKPNLFKSAIAVLAALVGLLLFYFFPEFYLKTQQINYDLLLQHFPHQYPVNTNLILVLIDDKTISQYTEIPIRRATHAKMAKLLAQVGVQCIVWDLIFALRSNDQDQMLNAMTLTSNYVACGYEQKESNDTQQERKQLFYALHSLKGIESVSGYIPRRSVGVLPDEAFVSSSHGMGFVNVLLDSDGVIRRCHLLVNSEGHFVPSLALRAAVGSLGISKDEVKINADSRTLELGIKTLKSPICLPLDENSAFYFTPLSLNHPNLDHRSYASLMNSLEQFPEDFKEGMQGKTVIIGTSFTGSGDNYVTASSSQTPGCLIHLSIINSILNNQRCKIIKPAWVLLITVAGVLLIGIFNALMTPLFSFMAFGLLMSCMIGMNVGLYQSYNIVFPVILPILVSSTTAAMVWAVSYMQEHLNAKALVKKISRFISPMLLKDIISANAKQMSKKVMRQEISILFIDIAGFTAFSEKSEPEEVSAYLAAYYDLAMSVIIKHQGILDKFLGDGLLAYWNGPDHELATTKAAMEIMRTFQETIAGSALKGESLTLRCGITTGYATIGYIGTEKYATYTIIGNPVNLASRLQNYAKAGEIVMDRRTATKIRPGIEVKSGDKIAVKGIEEPVEVWHVVNSK